MNKRMIFILAMVICLGLGTVAVQNFFASSTASGITPIMAEKIGADGRAIANSRPLGKIGDDRAGGVNPNTPGVVSAKDDTRREIILAKPATRVAAMSSSDSELLLALGIEPVGVTLSKDLPKDSQAKLAKYPSVGSAASPSVERIVDYQTELVFGISMPFHTGLRKIFDANGIASYFHISSDYEDIIELIHNVGVLTGKTKEAEAMIARYNKKLTDINARHVKDYKPRILIIFGAPFSYQMATSNTYVGDIFKHLGAVNVADEFAPPNTSEDEVESFMSGFIPLNLETMSIIHCDKVFLISHGRAEDGETFKKAFKNPAWQNVPAVREGKVEILPASMFSTVPAGRMEEVLDYGEEVLYGKP